jgi:hypothetical protein
MSAKSIILNNNDLVFHIAEFIDDNSSFNLFNSNKYYNAMIKNNQHRYTIKKKLTMKNNKNLILSSNYKIKTIEVYENFYQYDIDNLPKYIDNLYISLTSKQKNITINNLPSKLKHLKVFGQFNNSIDHLPNSLKKLSISNIFNQNIDKLPDSLTHLDITGDFNKPIDHLPKYLETLHLGYVLNQNIDKLPNSLTHLVIGGNFNKPIDHLPSSLTYLELNGSFNQPIDHLPKNLKKLVFFSTKQFLDFIFLA